MKKFLLIGALWVIILIILIILGVIGWNAMLSKLDEVVKDLDHKVVILEICENDQQCIDAVESFYPDCKPEKPAENSQQFFMQVQPIINCLSEKSQVDFNKFIQ